MSETRSTYASDREDKFMNPILFFDIETIADPNAVALMPEPSAPAKGLKWVCKRYGIDNPLPELNGSQVAGMDPETLRAYARNDVCMVVDLYKRMRGVYFSDGGAG